MAAMRRFSRAVALLAGVVVLAITLLISYDVGMRYLFDSPQLFVDELAGFLQVFVIFAGLGYTFLTGNHVRVDLVTARLASPNRARLRLVSLGAGLVVILITTWVTGSSMLTAFAYERVSTVELYPLWMPMATIPAGLLLLAATMIVTLVRQWRALCVPGGRVDEVPLEDEA